MTDITASGLERRDAYLQAKIVNPKDSDDALHVALATVAGCPLIVSWNFHHIVHLQKIPYHCPAYAITGAQRCFA